MKEAALMVVVVNMRLHEYNGRKEITIVLAEVEILAVEVASNPYLAVHFILLRSRRLLKTNPSNEIKIMYHPLNCTPITRVINAKKSYVLYSTKYHIVVVNMRLHEYNGRKEITIVLAEVEILAVEVAVSFVVIYKNSTFPIVGMVDT
ncbi:hypothetical protein DPMN_058006 [Dreissena polymorpha]|uniref:Uncharacterized protein n=1 Tax=Dreissena polymorpha TaxID=45954 RepID=A0A9D4C175_DREPO|nr:hypothetical protein DPMN_058006 [Dreissena polymorpha]